MANITAINSGDIIKDSREVINKNFSALDDSLKSACDIINKKVDKADGKGLSTNDYTSAEKTKLAGVETGAQVNKVTSVAGKTGVVTLSKSDVGLSNLDNVKQVAQADFQTHISDSSKHLSAGELSNKVSKSGDTIRGVLEITSVGGYGGGVVIGDLQGNETLGYCAITHGLNNTASGGYARAAGNHTQATNFYAYAEGASSTASGEGAHAEGLATEASGRYSHAEGSNAKAIGSSSHAEGYITSATGDYSHSEGGSTTASEKYAHAEGSNSSATAISAHAEGGNTTASGLSSHAEGAYTVASGRAAHSEGEWTFAEGANAHAEGYQTHANRNYSHICGKYGTIPADSDILFAVANGTGISASKESLALTVHDNGEVKVKGLIYTEGKKVATVNDIDSHAKGINNRHTDKSIKGTMLEDSAVTPVKLDRKYVQSINGITPDENGNVNSQNPFGNALGAFASSSIIGWYGSTSGNSETELFLGNCAGQRWRITQNSLISFKATVQAFEPSLGCKVLEFTGTVRRGDSPDTFAFVGEPTFHILAQDAQMDTCSAKFLLDTANGSLNLLVKGISGKNIRWAAKTEFLETIF